MGFFSGLGISASAGIAVHVHVDDPPPRLVGRQRGGGDHEAGRAGESQELSSVHVSHARIVEVPRHVGDNSRERAQGE
jgi:hypothetical protein